MAENEVSFWIKLKDGVSDTLNDVKKGFGDLMSDFTGMGVLAVGSIAGAFMALKKRLTWPAKPRRPRQKRFA